LAKLANIKHLTNWQDLEDGAPALLHLGVYLLCRSADKTVLLVRAQDTFGVGLVDAKSLAWYRREGNVPGTVAFESAASPGSFLTHSNYRMYTSANSKEGLACTFYAVARAVFMNLAGGRYQPTSNGSFSAVPKPICETKYSLESP